MMSVAIHFSRLGALALLLLAFGCGLGSPKSVDRPNVLFVVVDTLRWDHIGCYGAERQTTPAIDGIAAGATRFDRAYSVAPWTMPSVASMFTGLYPSRHRANSFGLGLPDGVDTLAEILNREGYATQAVVSHSAIGSRNNFQQGFDVYLESEAKGHDHVSTNGVTGQAIGLLESLAAGEAPFLLFVHYFDPHYNYKRHPEYGFAAEAAGRLDGEQPMRELLRMAPDMTPEEARFLKDVYDEEIGFTDAGIGRLLERLEALGLDEDTIVILTADHGEGVLDHGDLGHTSSLYEELVRVPLILRGPGRTTPGSVVEEPVSLASLTPTILDLVGLDMKNRGFQVGSLAPLLGGKSRASADGVFCEVDFVPVRSGRSVGKVHKKAIVGTRYKLVRDDPTGRLELYDLETDPGETDDLSAREPERLEQLRDALETAVTFAGQDAHEPQTTSLDEQEIERLKALGYVGDD